MSFSGGSRYAVLGAGAWGTALARQLAVAGREVTLWAREPEVVAEVRERRENGRFLPGISLPDSLAVTDDLREAVAGSPRVFVVIPSQYAREVLRRIAPFLRPDAVLIVASKGIEIGSLALMTDICAEETPGRETAVLSGPSFAREVARGDPTAVVIAAARLDLARTLQEELSHGGLRLYTNSDLAGVQLAGALKNVFAVAAGVAAGLGFGSNTIAALITRSVAEMRRLGVAAGGRRETFDGLAGVGDLVLTCTGALSRNRSVGELIGQGFTLADAVAQTRGVAEGVETSRSARDLALRHGVEMPIVEQVHAVLHAGRSAREGITELMARRLRGEEEPA
jgi:glycerol-3-phosphate dehydrogenase (NAD(P)+)